MESGVSEGFNVSSASESGISYCKMPGVAGWFRPLATRRHFLQQITPALSPDCAGAELPLSAGVWEGDEEPSEQDVVRLVWKQQVAGRVPH